MTVTEPRPHFGPAALWIVLVFTLASTLSANPYEYGVGDTSITIPFTKAAAEPGLYPSDFLLQQRPFYYTYLWNALGGVHHALGIPLPILFFSFYFIALYLTFFGVYAIAMRLFGRRDVAVLSLVFLLFTKPTLGGVDTVESVLSTRQAAVPLLLWAMAAFIDAKIVGAFALAGLAYLIHPLTTHYVLGMMLLAGLYRFRGGRLRSLGIGVLAFLAVASPLLIWKATHTPASMHLLRADPAWIEALELRSWLHFFPLEWGWGHTLEAVLTCVLFGIGWAHRRGDASDRDRERHHIVLDFAVAIAAMYGLALLFTEGLPVGLFLQLQLGRAFQFMEYFAMIYVAAFLCRLAREALRPRDLGWAAVVLGSMFVGTYFWLRGVTLMLPVALVVAVLRLTGRRPLREGAFVFLVVALLGVESAAYALRDAMRHDGSAVSLADGQDDDWLAVQSWARHHTHRCDSFIVPPLEDGEFRVEAERTVYADWKDGGLMNGNPAFGIEWMRRMRLLGLGDPTTFEGDFLKLPDSNFTRIAGEARLPGHRVFLILPRNAKARPFPIHYRNAGFIVYEVPERRNPPRGSRAARHVAMSASPQARIR